MFILMLYSLYQLQIIQGDSFREIAEKNYVRIKRIPPVRGEIFDRKYRKIAINKPSLDLYFIPAQLKNKDKTIDFIQKSFHIEETIIRKTINDNRFRTFREVLLLHNVSFEEYVKTSEYLNYYPSLLFKPGSGREYSFPNHITGYVGKINEKEYKLLKNDGYILNDVIGKSGLEKYYESSLRGKAGHKIIQVNAVGKNLKLFKYNLEKKPQNGSNLITTIDVELQNYIRDIIPENSKAAIIVMDVKSGGILSYISFPEYDQNIFLDKISSKTWNELINNENKPLLDRVIQGTYPPGSVYKPIVATLGLEMKLVNEQTKLDACTGEFHIGNSHFHCWLRTGHGRLNVVDALKYSCDVYFYNLSVQYSLEDIYSFNHLNFLDSKTGIDLFGERNGFFPDRAWYKSHYGKYTSIIGQKINLSIGQGEILTTPLQICAYYTAIANDGLWKQPHLLEKKITANSTEMYEAKYTDRHLPVSEKNLQIIQKALYNTVQGKYGTGNSAKVKNVKVFGKTGSAENYMSDLTHAWFAGYAKWENPEIAFTIFFETAGHGGSVAAPIAAQIIDYYHKNIRTNP